MNMYVYGWVAGRFRWVGFVCVGLVWLSVELINFAKEGRHFYKVGLVWLWVELINFAKEGRPVSYTHLTLPTIYSV